MGLAERDYARDSSASDSRFAAMREWSATTWLIAAYVAVFVLDAILTPPPHLWGAIISDADAATLAGEMSSGAYVLRLIGPIARWGHFSLATLHDLQVWRIVTFPFVHTDAWPLFVNVACLYFFGRVMEARLGPRRFLAFYFACGLAAPAAYVALHAIQVRIGAPWLPLLGASGSVLGLLTAAACVAPDDEVPVATTGISVPRRALAWVACAVLAVIAIKQDSTGAGAAHLGGAVAGLLAVPLLRRVAARQNL